MGRNVQRFCQATGRFCARSICESSCALYSTRVAALKAEDWVDIEDLTYDPVPQPKQPSYDAQVKVGRTGLRPKKRDPNNFAGSYEVKRTFHKKRLPVENGLVAFSSSEGRNLFQSALRQGGLEGSYWSLSENYMTQSDPSYCGLTSLSMVLNSLNVDPGRRWKGPWRWYNEDEFDCGCLPETHGDAGVTLRELAYLASCNTQGATIERRHAEPQLPAYGASLEDFRAAVRRVCEASGHQTRLIAQFDRAALGQTGTGHYSPIGGYDKATDRVLVMEVARFKYFQFWIPVEDLYQAMTSLDESTGQARGWLEISATSSPCGDCERGPEREGAADSAHTSLSGSKGAEERRCNSDRHLDDDPTFRMCWGDAVSKLIAALRRTDHPPDRGRTKATVLDAPDLPLLDAAWGLEETALRLPTEAGTNTGEADTMRPPEIFLGLGDLVDSRAAGAGEVVKLDSSDLVDLGLEPEMRPPQNEFESLMHELFAGGGMHGGRVAVRPDYSCGAMTAEQVHGIQQAVRGTRVYRALTECLPERTVPLASMLALGLGRSSDAAGFLLPRGLHHQITRQAQHDVDKLPSYVQAEVENIAKLLRLSVLE